MRFNMHSWTLLVLAMCLPGGHMFAMYKDEIPNGESVPNPCKPNFMWAGVGHENPLGGGARNPFGRDFAANGKVWNEVLCHMDSDGDGLTNGEELGDPNCIWTKGQAPSRVRNLSHPGVCDPWDSPDCVSRNVWLDCTQDEVFDCEYINDPNVRNITLRFPETKVPAKETTYICFNFNLPDDQEYHVIASKPYIDNKNVMHHIVLSGCDSSVGLRNAPEECSMGTAGCSSSLPGWTVGMLGTCIIPQTGFLIGKGHITTVSMQLHWTNPGLVDEWFDSSGMTLYYTPKLRPYNAATITLGQMSLNIPPAKSAWVQSGTCTSRCSQKILRGDVHAFSGLSHMHLLGIRQNATLRRPGQPVKVLADDNPYRYDSPVLHDYDPTITLKPGDELQTHCTYKSLSRPKTTNYGDGTYEEMCFFFIDVYPAENITDGTCVQWKDMDTCDVFENCDFRIFNSSDPATSDAISKILANCDPSGICREECPAAVREVKAANNCVRNMWDYVKTFIYQRVFDPYLFKFIAAMESCDDHSDVRTSPKPPQTTASNSGPDDGSLSGPGSMLINLVKHLDVRPLLQNIIMNVNYNTFKADNHENTADDHARKWH